MVACASATACLPHPGAAAAAPTGTRGSEELKPWKTPIIKPGGDLGHWSAATVRGRHLCREGRGTWLTPTKRLPGLMSRCRMGGERVCR